MTHIVVRTLAVPTDASALICLDADSDDPIVLKYLKGETDNDYMIHVMLELTAPGDRVIDLGSHVGTFALASAALGRHVWALDANAAQVALLERSVAENGFANLHCRHGAISQSEGVVRFIENGLFGSIDYQNGSAAAVEVPACTLDSIFDAIPGRVSYLKMDIEGAEYDALVTGERSIREHLPAIWFESNGMTLQMAGRSVAELRHLFESWSYKVFRASGDRWVYAPPTQMQPEGWVDMLALHESAIGLWSARIDWDWSDELMYSTTQVWASLPYPNTREYLRQAILEYQSSDDRYVDIAAGLDR